MPNRVLREGLRSSEAINSLSDAAERLYVRLLVSADDYGLLEMRPSWVKAHAVPLLDWTLPTVAKLLGELVDQALLLPYEDAGKQYAAVSRWSQRIEAKRPKFPMPPWGREHIVGGVDRSMRDRSRTSGALPSGRPVDAHAMPTTEERGTRNEERGARNEKQSRGRSPAARASRANEHAANNGSHGSRLDPELMLPEDWRAFCERERPDLDPVRTFARFRDYWTAKPGKDGRKTDWLATWRNWVRNERGMVASNVADPLSGVRFDS